MDERSGYKGCWRDGAGDHHSTLERDEATDGFAAIGMVKLAALDGAPLFALGDERTIPL